MSSSAIQRPWKLWMDQLCNAWKPISMVAIAFTFTGFFGEWGWLFDLMGIFRVQYAMVLGVGVVIFLVSRKWVMSSVCVVGLAANMCAIAPLYFTDTVVANQPPQSRRIRVLQMNVNSRNRQFASALSQIRQLTPDVISVEEVDDAWEKFLVTNLTDYPFMKIRSRPDNFGIAVFSKLPLNDPETVYLGAARVPSISATINIGATSIRWLSVHVLPPRTLDYFQYRNDELDRIAEFLCRDSMPVVLAGDLNSPPWSYYFQKLCTRAVLADSERGHGVQPTWPMNTVLLRIPIDHLLTRGPIKVVNRFVTGAIGSDHFPVCADLEVNP